MVLHWARNHRVLIDAERVSQMFAEADYRREGSLSTEILLATVLGRYPMRKFKQEWIDLVDLVLDSSRNRQNVEGLLQIGDRALQGYVETRGPELASFNAKSFWTEPPLPFSPDRFRQRPPAAAGTEGRCGGSPGKHLYQDENQPVNGSSRSKAETLYLEGDWLSDFSCRGRFDSQMCTRDSMIHGLHNARKAERRIRRLKSKRSSASWDLPQSPSVLPKSALTVLRASINGSVCHKPRFEVFHSPLRPCDATFKRSMGETDRDIRDIPLNRIEPVRPTSTPFNSDYVRWADLARRCPTAPTRWISSHPVNPLF